MNQSLFLEQLGLASSLDKGQLPIVLIDNKAITLSDHWSAEALSVAVRRGTPLLIVDDQPLSGPPGCQQRPWPLIVVSTSPWAVRDADLGLLIGTEGPADYDGLDERSASQLVKHFLAISAPGESKPPQSDRSLLDIVPFAIADSYEPEAVLECIVDDSDWLEIDSGTGPELLTVVARIDGRTMGIAASRPSRGDGRLGIAGCARVAHLLRLCERGGMPMISLVDTAGLDNGEDALALSVVRETALSMRRSPVMKMAVVLGRANGLAATVMGAVGARAGAILPWPRARFALNSQTTPTVDDKEANEESVLRAALEGGVMDIIHPDDTRNRLIEMLELLRGHQEYSA